MSEEEVVHKSAFSFEDIKNLAIITPYSIKDLQEHVVLFETGIRNHQVQIAPKTARQLFKNFIDASAQNAMPLHELLSNELLIIGKEAKTKNPMNQTITMVASPTVHARYENLFQLSVAEPLEAFNLHYMWSKLLETKDNWNHEVYIISRSEEVSDIKVEEDIGYFVIDKSQADRIASIAAFIKKEHRKKGVMSSCLQFVANRVFNEMGYHRLWATALSTNEQGVKFYNKYLKEEGVERHMTTFQGQIVNRHRYGLLKSDVKFDRNGVCKLREDLDNRLPRYLKLDDMRIHPHSYDVTFDESLEVYKAHDVVKVFHALIFEDADGSNSGDFDADATRNGIRINEGRDPTHINIGWGVAQELYEKLRELLGSHTHTMQMAKAPNAWQSLT